MRFESDVRVCGFPKYRGRNFAIVQAFEVDIQEGNLIVHLFFPCEFYSRMD